MNVRCALAGSALAVRYSSRFAVCVVQPQTMIDCSGSSEKNARQLSRLPFHSTWRVTTRRTVREMSRRITRYLGRSSQMTVSAFAQTRSRTFE